MMLRDGAAATWMFKMAKAARKRNAGLAVITQDAADVLGSQLGQAVVANAATQILMRQAPQAIDAVALTGEERHLLLQARPGEALLVAGSYRVRYQVVASGRELPLVLTSSQPNQPQASIAAPAWADDDTDLF